MSAHLRFCFAAEALGRAVGSIDTAQKSINKSGSEDLDTALSHIGAAVKQLQMSQKILQELRAIKELSQ